MLAASYSVSESCAAVLSQKANLPGRYYQESWRYDTGYFSTIPSSEHCILRKEDVRKWEEF